MNNMCPDIKNLNIFFDGKIIFVGGFVDHLELQLNIKDIDLIIDKDIFYKKLGHDLSIKKNNFDISYQDTGVFSHTNIAMFQGKYNQLPVDIFLIDTKKESTNKMYLIQKEVMKDYDTIEYCDTKLKINKPIHRIRSLEYIMNIDEKECKLGWQKHWLKCKKEIIPSKINSYFKKYPPKFLT